MCATVVAEFANVSLDILRKGTQNNKGFAKAASELLRPVLSLGVCLFDRFVMKDLAHIFSNLTPNIVVGCLCAAQKS